LVDFPRRRDLLRRIAGCSPNHLDWLARVSAPRVVRPADALPDVLDAFRAELHDFPSPGVPDLGHDALVAAGEQACERVAERAWPTTGRERDERAVCRSNVVRGSFGCAWHCPAS
jgi:hypothetical protein